MQVKEGVAYLEGSRDFGFAVIVEGTDLVCHNVTTSWFGGPRDPDDNGDTASGTPDHVYGVMGCSLALNGDGDSVDGSPWPRLPWKTTVKVYCIATGRSIEVPLIDIGPSFGTKHAIDLTEAAFVALFADTTDESLITKFLDTGLTQVDIRIVGGARYLSPSTRAALVAAGLNAAA